MLKVKNLHKEYIKKDNKGKKTVVKAVDNVSLNLQENKSYSLVGESGSGKSTLARLITYIEKPTKGEIRIDDQDISKMSKDKLRFVKFG